MQMQVRIFNVLLGMTEYCERYAKRENVANTPVEDGSEEEVSDEESDSSDNDIAGHVDL